MKKFVYRLNGKVGFAEVEENGGVTADAEILWSGQSEDDPPPLILALMNQVAIDKNGEENQKQQKKRAIRDWIDRIDQVQDPHVKAILNAMAQHLRLKE